MKDWIREIVVHKYNGYDKVTDFEVSNWFMFLLVLAAILIIILFR